MLLIDNDVVKKVLRMDECIDVIIEVFKGLLNGDSIQRPRIDVYIPSRERPDGYYRWGTMEGGNKILERFAIRMKSDIITWPRDEFGNWSEKKYCVEPGTYCGLVLLFSTRNGEPLAIINEGYLQHMRVAAGAGIGAKYLSRKNSKIVGIIGSGGMARSYLKAFCAVRDIQKAKVYSPNRARRKQYAEEMSQELAVEIEPVNEAREAVRGVDIVATCTDSLMPVLKGEWLEPGMHVTDLSRSELGEDVFIKADVIIKQGISELIPQEKSERIKKGVGGSPVAYIAGSQEEMARMPISAHNEWFSLMKDYPHAVDVISGKVKGRNNDKDITIYLNIGNQGLQFIAVGDLVYRKAKELGLGKDLPTEWFLQNIRD